MLDVIENYLSDERADSAIEYGIIASLISVFIVAALISINSSMVDIYSNIENSVSVALGER